MTAAQISQWADRAAYWSLAVCAVVAPLGMAPQEITVVCAIAAWAISRLASRTLPARTSVNWLLLLWCAAAVISIAYSTHVPTSLKGLQKMAKVIGLFFVAAEMLRTRQRCLTVVTAMMLGAAVVAMDGLIQVAFGADLFYRHVAGGAPGGLPRLSATFGHANDFAIYAVTVLPVCLVMALPSTTLRRRWWAWGTVGLLLAALLMTFSRPAVLAVSVSSTVFLLLRRAWKSLAAFAAALIIGALCLPAPIREWVAQQPSWLHVIAQPLRFEIWQAGVNMIRAHPVFGIGVNLFVRNYEQYRIPGDTLVAAYGHNHYLQMAAEIGFVGLGIFVWLLIRTGAVWRRLLGHPSAWVRHLSLGMGCGIVAFLAIGLLESALYSSRTNLFFWLWMGTLHGLAQLSPEERGS